MRSYLLILGEREAVAWVLRHQRMAFPARRRAEAGRLESGDELLIYTTRGCWHNPGRDMSRIIGRAYVTSPVKPLEAPVEVAGRTFESGCRIDVRTLTPYLTGVELAPLVEDLAVFPVKSSWSIRLRRPLLELPDGDAEMLRGHLAEVEASADEVVDGYLQAIKPVAGQGTAPGE
jgi:hypothetical protein